VVKAGEQRFRELDSKYVSNCRNLLVKAAVPKAKQSRPCFRNAYGASWG
jgi:hypothetical protein